MTTAIAKAGLCICNNKTEWLDGWLVVRGAGVFLQLLCLEKETHGFRSLVLLLLKCGVHDFVCFSFFRSEKKILFASFRVKVSQGNLIHEHAYRQTCGGIKSWLFCSDDQFSSTSKFKQKREMILWQ